MTKDKSKSKTKSKSKNVNKCMMKAYNFIKERLFEIFFLIFFASQEVDDTSFLK